jgi:hypothetical protein
MQSGFMVQALGVCMKNAISEQRIIERGWRKHDILESDVA